MVLKPDDREDIVDLLYDKEILKNDHKGVYK